jgi:hypothetical protein
MNVRFAVAMALQKDMIVMATVLLKLTVMVNAMDQLLWTNAMFVVVPVL